MGLAHDEEYVQGADAEWIEDSVHGAGGVLVFGQDVPDDIPGCFEGEDVSLVVGVGPLVFSFLGPASCGAASGRSGELRKRVQVQSLP
jgi:hypothetical protein